MVAPIALFVYNRPMHTRRTIEALQQNALSRESDLVIFSDAPKTEEHAESVKAVRAYIRTIRGFKSVSIVERDRNLGLADSIIDGVSSVVNAYGKIIVLEDDLETSPAFLEYMNGALNAYEEHERVMHISGYMFPIASSGLPDTFFLRTTSCWGWATWGRAWKHFEKKPKQLVSEYTREKVNRFNMDGAYDFWSQVKGNELGLLNTWAVFWYATVFNRNGLSLHPRQSYCRNFGHDDSGVHCRNTSVFDVTLAMTGCEFEKNIEINSDAEKRLKIFFRGIRQPLWRRVAARVKNALTAYKLG